MLTLAFSLYSFVTVGLIIFANIVLMEVLAYSGITLQVQVLVLTVVNVLVMLGSVGFMVFSQARISAR